MLARPVVGQVLRPFFAALQVLGNLRTLWTPSHQGESCNEFADFLTKQVQTGATWGGQVFPPSEEEGKALLWMWLAWQHQLTGRGPGFEHEHLVIPAPKPIVGHDVDQWTLPQSGAEVTLAIDLVFTTYNVNTLNTDRVEQGRRTRMAKEALLMQQSGAHHVLLLQETRIRKSCQVMKGSWLCISAGAHQGQGGVEVWLNTAKPIGHRKGADGVQKTVLL